jgi:hypothetical protein
MSLQAELSERSRYSGRALYELESPPEDAYEHPYRRYYAFTGYYSELLRGFAIGVGVGFVVGFIVALLVFWQYIVARQPAPQPVTASVVFDRDEAGRITGIHYVSGGKNG